MRSIHFESDDEFGSFFSMLHLGSVLSSNLHRDRTLNDVEREADLYDALAAVSDDDPSHSYMTPAGTRGRQLRQRCAVAVDGETLKMIDKYVRYAAERCAPDFARTAATALRVVRRAVDSPESEP